MHLDRQSHVTRKVWVGGRLEHAAFQYCKHSGQHVRVYQRRHRNAIHWVPHPHQVHRTGSSAGSSAGSGVGSSADSGGTPVRFGLVRSLDGNKKHAQQALYRLLADKL